jgi:hypothetical protein
LIAFQFDDRGTVGGNKSLQKIRTQLNLPAMTNSDISRTKTEAARSGASHAMAKRGEELSPASRRASD